MRLLVTVNDLAPYLSHAGFMKSVTQHCITPLKYSVITVVNEVFNLKFYTSILLTCTCNLLSIFVHYIYLEEFDANTNSRNYRHVSF